MEFQAQAPVCKSWEGGHGWSLRVSGGEQEIGSQQWLGFANQLSKQGCACLREVPALHE